MALTEFQKAFLKNALISKDQVIDPATGSPLDWDALGGDISGISDVPGLQAALDAKQAAATAATDAEVAAAIAALSSVYQPLDSDLTSIAALSTTSFGRAFLALADAAAGRTTLGIGLGLILVYLVPSANSFDFTSASYVNIDTTNFAPTITVPPSGKILVRCRFTMNASAQQDCAMAIRNGSDATLAEAYTPVYTIVEDFSPEFYITGQTPGASLQLRFAMKITSGATGHLYRNSVSAGYGGGPVVITVWEAP